MKNQVNEALDTIRELREVEKDERRRKMFCAVLDYLGVELVETLDGEWKCIKKEIK